MNSIKAITSLERAEGKPGIKLSNEHSIKFEIDNEIYWVSIRENKLEVRTDMALKITPLAGNCITVESIK